MSQAANSLATLLCDGLNVQQREAVEQEKGSLLVLAGAGSGKTRVITARIAHLIVNKGVKPAAIIALTFTNKAAKEMRERVTSFVSDGHDVPFIGTFHAYCLRLLKQHTQFLTVPFNSILDEEDQQKLLGSILQRFDLDKKTHVKQLLYQISQFKNRMISPSDISQDRIHDPSFVPIYQAYEAEKRINYSLDFDDLLLETVALFKKNESLRIQWQNHIKHVLVDEYQDTNVVQHTLLKQMTLAQKHMTVDSVCVVGDEDQSIYSWRGATVENIAHFTTDFTDTRIIKIEQNYRSVAPIVAVANAIVAYNKQRNPKKLWSERTGKDRIRLITCVSDRQEGDLIAQALAIARQSDDIESCAVLYRAHFQSRSIEEALIKRSLAYRIIGGTQFYERKEIKDILAYLKLIANPHDRVSFFRIINCPARGLGEQFETIFRDRWHDEPTLPFHEIGAHLVQQQVLTGVRRNAIEQFMMLVKHFKSTDSPLTTTEQIIIKTGYLAYLTHVYEKEEALERQENIKELLRALKQFEQQGSTTISAFLDEVAIIQEHASRDNTQSNPVLLMTIHAAKGLEFDIVAITGLEEGILPSSRSLVSPESLEEERRLCYVAITRAKNYLLLSHCRYRYAYGQTSDQLRSRFIDEMPTVHISTHNCIDISNHQATLFFSNWLKSTALSRKESTTTLTPQKLTVSSLKKPKSSRITNEQSPQQSRFKKYQTVEHATFGKGIVQSIDNREDGTVLVEVRFAQNTKKIAASFLSTS